MRDPLRDKKRSAFDRHCDDWISDRYNTMPMDRALFILCQRFIGRGATIEDCVSAVRNAVGSRDRASRCRVEAKVRNLNAYFVAESQSVFEEIKNMEEL